MSALILTSVLGVLLLYLGVFGNKRLLAPVAVLGLLGAIGVSATGWWMDVPLFAHMVRFDGAATAFNMGMTGLTILLFLFGVDYYARMERDVAEHYALMVFSLTGAFLLTSYTNLLVLFLGIEVLSAAARGRGWTRADGACSTRAAPPSGSRPPRPGRCSGTSQG